MNPEARSSDWHVHTDLSDGMAAPEEVVRAAAALGLEEIAITDHDGVDAHRGGGLARAAAAAGVRLVAGVEIDCTVGDRETEVLGFGFDPDHPRLVERLARVQAQRRDRFLFYAAGLARLRGHALDPAAAIFSPPPATRAPMKVHLYRAATAAGLALEGGYLEFKASLAALGTPPPVDRPSLVEAVDLVREAGGVALLAHPLYYAEPIGLEPLLRAGAAAGCSGVELVYPYTFGSKGLPGAKVRVWAAELAALVPRCFPQGATTSRGTDVHDLVEWGQRLAALDRWDDAEGGAGGAAPIEAAAPRPRVR